MAHAFIIMQIGNQELDEVCARAMVPAIEAVGLSARRVDKHNQGGLLKSEIVKFIEEADIIVADLTNERPNCYLEIGYAMGIDKFRNLILTVREDHFADNPGHKPGGPKVHFDLGGYDILAWHPERVDDFRVELEKRIRRRRTIVGPGAAAATPVWDEAWIAAQQATANSGFLDAKLSGFMEVRFALEPPKSDFPQQTLKDAAREAPLRTFGWPLAPYIDDDKSRPRPRVDGIYAEIRNNAKPSYDYWAIKRTGDFYWAGSLFEDSRRPGFIFFNTRIVRATEALLYCARLYSALGVDRAAPLRFAVRHGGLRNRILSSSSANRDLGPPDLRSAEAEVETEIRLSIDQIEADLVNHVKSLIAPLFVLFDFFVLADSVYEDIVNRFVKGDVS